MKIQNKKFSDQEVVFPVVGPVTGDNNGVFELLDDEIAEKIVAKVPGWQKIIESASGSIRRQVVAKKDETQQPEEETDKPSVEKPEQQDSVRTPVASAKIE